MASPAELMVATELLPVVQVAADVTFAVELSLYVAVAVNCNVTPVAILGAAGDTAIEETDFTVTVRAAVALTAPDEAVTLVVPAATPVARPPELMVATELLAVAQVTAAVTLAVELSLYVAVAVNCWVWPAEMFAVAGEIAIAVSVFAVTVSAAVALTLPNEAVIVAEPAAMPVATPAALMVAAETVELDQVTVEVMSPVDPSL